MNPTTPASGRRCIHCGAGPREVELRPYGKDGQPICSECMRATPERKEEAQRQLRARLGGVGLRPPAVLPAGLAERAAVARTVPPTCARCAQPIDPGDFPHVDGGRPVHATCPDWLDAVRADKAARNGAPPAEDADDGDPAPVACDVAEAER
ncbi:MAG TPA: hypothetical protein VE987_12900 [Polyangiaceae bacterium]|nr:hypothetical protein [Polyangiaceae bacterium]